MERFNPITDLQPIDPIDVPNTQVSDELESLRLRLKVTQEETSNIIQIIKEKNDSLNSDLKKLKNFNRRLNITIPRIPEMPGEAGVEFGEEVERERKRKKAGFRLPPRFPLIRRPVSVPQFKRPKLRKTLLGVKKGADIIGYSRGGGLVLKSLKNPKAAKDALQAFAKGTDIVDDLAALGKSTRVIRKKIQKTPDILGINRGRIVKKTLPKVNYSDIPLKERMRIASMNKKNFPKVSREGILTRRNARIKRDLLNLEKKIPEFEIFQFMKKANLKSPTLLKSNLNKAYTKEYQKILKNYKQNKIGVQDMLEQTDDLRKAYKTKALKIDRYGEEIMAIFERFKMRGLDVNKVKSNVIMKDVLEGIRKIKKQIPKPLEGKKIESGTFRYNKNKSRVNAKQMSNDIAMLNKDTGVTNTVIIITDPPTA